MVKRANEILFIELERGGKSCHPDNEINGVEIVVLAWG